MLRELSENKTINFEILGGANHPIVQVILLPNQSVTLMKNALLYLSDHVTIHNISHQALFLGAMAQVESAVNATNNSKGVGYLGISRKKGRLLAYNTAIQGNLVVKTANVLAYSANLYMNQHSQKGLPAFKSRIWSGPYSWSSLKAPEGQEGVVFIDSDCKSTLPRWA